MPVPNSDIALFNTVASELTLSGTPMKMSDVYAVANTAGLASSGSFHNLIMGTTNQNFAQIIWPSAQPTITNQSLSEWQGYNHDATAKITINMDDITGSGVAADLRVYLDDTAGTTNNLIFQKIFDANNLNPDNNPEQDSGIPAYSTFFFGTSIGYHINLIVVVFQPGTAKFMSITANDDDSVGANQGRQTYTDVYGPYNLAANGFIFDSTVLGSAGVSQILNVTQISWNKRTRININFLP